MKNRDYFNKPIQGNGRNYYDYGNTHLHHESAGESFSKCFAYAVLGFLSILVIYHVIRYFV